MISGSCLCGAVAYQAQSVHPLVTYCHCNFCRKAAGTAFSSNILADKEGFTILKGEEVPSFYQSSPGKTRVFCSKCGSPLYHTKEDQPDLITIKLGTLDQTDEDFSNWSACHIWTESEKPWLDYQKGNFFKQTKN